MRLDPSGVPFIAGALVAAVVAALAARPMWALPFLALALFFTCFFRDPERQSRGDRGSVLSPADGRVLVAGDPQPDAAPPGAWRQISIFLSPFDVHVNRVPISGRVTRIEYHRGSFLPAYRGDAAAANTRNEIWIDHGGQTVICRQVVGILARRLICRVEPGREVQAGERFGIMKFGSRIDLFLPPAAELKVEVGDKVRGGETVVARI